MSIMLFVFLGCGSTSSGGGGLPIQSDTGGNPGGEPSGGESGADYNYCDGGEGECATLRVINYTDERIIAVYATFDCEEWYELLADGVIQPDEDTTFSLPEGVYCDFAVQDSNDCWSESGEYAIYSGEDNWFKVWGMDICE